MKTLVILGLIAIGFVGTTFVQTMLRPLELLVAEWIGVAATVVLWMIVVSAYFVIAPVVSARRPVSADGVTSPHSFLRIGLAAALIAVGFLGAIGIRRYFLDQVTVPHTITAKAQRVGLERELGFRLSVEDLGDAQRIHFLRSAGRDIEVADLLTKEREKAAAGGPAK